jgi:hypothetical protein
MIDINRLDEIIKRDLNNIEAYPFMVIANIGKFRRRSNSSFRA